MAQQIKPWFNFSFLKRGTWRSTFIQSWGRLYTQWKSTSWVPEPKRERSHLGSVSSCPARENLLKSRTLIWDLFWVGVEPLGQPELSLPTEEENKLDRHHKVFSFSCTEYNLLSCFFFFRNSWECAWFTLSCVSPLPPLCGLANPYRGLLLADR